MYIEANNITLYKSMIDYVQLHKSNNYDGKIGV